jgi:hypothetical protein
VADSTRRSQSPHTRVLRVRRVPAVAYLFSVANWAFVCADVIFATVVGSNRGEDLIFISLIPSDYRSSRLA